MSGGAAPERATRPEPAAARGPIAWIEVRAPLLEVEAALAALRSLPDVATEAAGEGTGGEGPAASMAWIPAAGPAFAGAGAVATIRGGTAEHARPAAEALLARVHWDRAASEGPGPRLFGALPFVARGEAAPVEGDDPWSALRDGLLVLPRYRYTRDGDHAWLAVATEVAPGQAEVAVLRDAVDAALEALACEADPYDPPPPPALVEREELPRTRWAALLTDILDGIAAGRFEKVVAARRASLAFQAPLDPVAVLARLRESAEGCTRFLLSLGPLTFLGATPERLVARSGDHLVTEALAGSMARSEGTAEAEAGPEPAAALLRSDKDRVEHALVVREITRRLAPVCRPLEVEQTPRPRALRHLLHLHTPISGWLLHPTHVLDLVSTLHPTPAVGGLPADEARRFIVEREGAGRGLYSGPVGWCDSAGDGEFAVALRSALLDGDRAWLWVGAGIVAGSAAEAEYRETALKQRAMLGALCGGDDLAHGDAG